jgi:hypothetical protein
VMPHMSIQTTSSHQACIAGSIPVPATRLRDNRRRVEWATSPGLSLAEFTQQIPPATECLHHVSPDPPVP